MHALPRRSPVVFALTALFALASSGCQTILGIRSCDEPPPARLALAPPTLGATGLYAAPGTNRLAEGVRHYRPRFELWTDGATKERWVSLPKGATIETSDMDAWRFPIGTKLWKEISRDGKRVETRLLQKVTEGSGMESWLAVAYVWNAEGTEAVVAPEGLADANGTAHDVPPARACAGCHGGSTSTVLGFSAIQLEDTALEGDTSLGALRSDRRLSHPPAHEARIPGGAEAREALGYLHANCGHCHNRHRPAHQGARCFDPRTDFDLSLRTNELATPTTTAAYRTALGTVVSAGDPEGSLLYRRLAGTATFEPRMPALGVESTDARGVALVGRWIRGLR